MAKKNLCMKRDDYLIALAKDLCPPLMINRYLGSSRVSNDYFLKSDFSTVFGEDEWYLLNQQAIRNENMHHEVSPKTQLLGYCFLCKKGQMKDRCARYVCKEHRSEIIICIQ